MWEIIGTRLGIGVAAMALLSTFIEIVPVKFNPWTSILMFIGGKLNKSVEDRLQDIEKQTKHNNDAIAALQQEVLVKFEESGRNADEKEAKRLRANILCFADSCRVGVKHTQRHFENVFRDYDDYERYCNDHGFENHYVESDMEYITEVYKKCKKENSFI